MNATLIIDCSITMAWCFEDESTPKNLAVLDRLADEAALVPAHWYLEVSNFLAMAEKRRRITTAKSMEFLTYLGTLKFEIDHEVFGRAFDQLLRLCRAHGLTSYDAAYLDLALRRGIPLASLDDELRVEAKSLGIALLGK